MTADAPQASSVMPLTVDNESATALRSEVTAFVSRYSNLFASPACSDPDLCGNIARQVAQHYRSGVTFFTRGKTTRFESQEEAAALIEREMRKNVSLGLGTHLRLLSVPSVQVYSPTSVLCWLEWEFVPRNGSEYEGRGWRFRNLYGYRAASEGAEAGWEFVLRDEEVESMVRATGLSFEG